MARQLLWDFAVESEFVVPLPSDPPVALSSRLINFMCKWTFLPVFMKKVDYLEMEQLMKHQPAVIDSWGIDSYHTEELAKHLYIEPKALSEFLQLKHYDGTSFDPGVMLNPRGKRRRQWFQKWTTF